MSNTVTEQSRDATVVSRERRSTRVFQAIRLNISGRNKTGNAISESTSALAVNCHGCAYSSRHDYPFGSWVTLHVLSQHFDGKSHAVRAQVKFVRLPRNPRELYQVGVELEVPANIWGIQSPPQDWLRFPGNGATSAVTAADPAFQAGMTRTLEQKTDIPRGSAMAAIQQVFSSGSSDGDKAAQICSSDLLQHTLEGILQQAATKAVESALSSRLNTAVDRAAKAIENFSQASSRRVEEHCARTREKFETSVWQDFVARMQSDITAAEEQLRKQIENSLAKAEHAAQVLEGAATEIPSRLAGALADLESSGRELQSQCSIRLREAVDRATSDFRDETTRVSGEQLSSWSEKITAATEEAGVHFKKRAAEADTRLETAAARSIATVQAMAKDEIARITIELHERVKSSLTSLAAEARAEWDACQRARQNEVARLGQQEAEQFRQRLEAILNSAMAAAISAANEHSRILLDSLLRGTVEQLREGK